MENSALLSPKFPLLASSPKPILTQIRRFGCGRKQRFLASASKVGIGDGSLQTTSTKVFKKLEMHNFASLSSSSNSKVSTASGMPQLPVPPQPSYIGSPLFWIGVGVGISALFSMVATKVKQYALQQAFKTMMGQAAPQNGQFSNSAFPQGPPFPFPLVSAPDSSTQSPSFSSMPLAASVDSRPAVTVDVPSMKVETVHPAEVKDEPAIIKETKKYAFIDVSPEELQQKDIGYSKDSASSSPSSNVDSGIEVISNGAAGKQDANSSTGESQSRKTQSVLSVEALEKMMEDPTVQKMVYPYLPEEMRNPTTFKWMLQNPQYRQQLQDMLNNMGGSGGWDSNMMDSLKNFDLSSPEVKQQFDQIGLTPEEVISKIMANPEVAVAFQNPRVQAAIMDCSQNPLNIAKYQNDKEIQSPEQLVRHHIYRYLDGAVTLKSIHLLEMVMDVFTKISELFPGVTGY